MNVLQTFAASPALDDYRRELALWLSGDAQEDERLVLTGAALCEIARELSVLPEQLLVVIRDGRAAPVCQEGSDRAARESQARAHRYTLAVNLLLDCYVA
jgi:hypothetical protein